MPDYDASFADDLQWLALERPNALTVVQYLVKGLVARHRPPPAPAITMTLSPALEYRDITVTDARALFVPAEGRIGKRMIDVVPAFLMDQIDRKLHTARKTHRVHTVPPFLGPHGKHWDVRILVPTPDLVLVNVHEAPR